MQHQFILIIDFGGQYNQLIARRVREENVYCEVHSYKNALEVIKEKKPIGIILTGGPNSVYGEKAPRLEKEIYFMNIPILGICYGAQLMAFQLGGKVAHSDISEYGETFTKFDLTSDLFHNMYENGITWMSHTDYIQQLPDGFINIASAPECPYAAIFHPNLQLYGVQFHPEVTHTVRGQIVIHNFLYRICHCTGDWSMENYKNVAIDEIKRKVSDGKVLLALSGGVDSSVAAALISSAIGRRLTCVFVDHGFLRKDEGDQVENIFKSLDLNFIRINAQERFLSRLAGITDPEEKRKIIGEEFIRVFEEQAKIIGKVDYFAQGTIYPDIIESGLGDAAVIKSHHNVGGLPAVVDFKELIEPLRLLFKDEVRQLGIELGLSEELVNRQPFPGPGLAIRIIGEITKQKLSILKEADAVFRYEILKANLQANIDQYFAVLTNMRSVGVMGDERTYDYVLALRAVSTNDFMTANFADIPYKILARISNRMINQVDHINRVVYDITTKPPATIEWE